MASYLFVSFLTAEWHVVDNFLILSQKPEARSQKPEARSQPPSPRLWRPREARSQQAERRVTLSTPFLPEHVTSIGAIIA
jgi:hypothetical protein